MKVLLDENLSAAIVHELRERGIDALHARDAGLAAADDDAILEKQSELERGVAMTVRRTSTRIRDLPLTVIGDGDR